MRKINTILFAWMCCLWLSIPLMAQENCEADAGSWEHDIYKLCSGNYIKAIEMNAPSIPLGYELVFFVTLTNSQIIIDLGNTPTFGPMTALGPNEPAYFNIHALVYDPATLNLNNITLGTSTISDVNSLLIQGGGDTCAALDMEGPEFKLVDCNYEPDVVDDVYATLVNQSINMPVLINDSDPEGSTVTILEFNQPSNGTVVQVGNELVYTPNPDFTGLDTFTYYGIDEDGMTDIASVFIQVYSEEDPDAPDPNPNPNPNPEPDPDTEPVDPQYCDEVMDMCTPPVTPIVICPDFCNIGDDSSISDVSVLYPCSLFNENGCVTYTPLPGFEGNETLEIEACDSNNNCSIVIVNMLVSETCLVDQPPVATNDSASTNGTGISIIVINNDFDPDGDTFSITNFTLPQSGTVTFNEFNAFTYTPNSGFNGTDSFTYEICDSDDMCDIGTVTIEVTQECSNTQNLCTEIMTPVEICINDCQLGTSVEIVHVNTLYECSINDEEGSNCFIYLPLPGFTGPEEITVTACDAAGNCGDTVVSMFVGDCSDFDGMQSGEDQFKQQNANGLDTDCLKGSNQMLTPDGDGFNDNFAMPHLSNCYADATYEFEIYNLNGQLVYQNKEADIQALWNANTTFNTNTGMYCYRLKVKQDAQIAQVLSGMIQFAK